MKKDYHRLIKALGIGKVLINEPLHKYTSFKIGGPAHLFFKAKTKEDLVNVITLSCKLNIPFFVLGGGSNLLINDKGFKGLVIKNETSEIKLVSIKGGQYKRGKGNKPPKTTIKEVYLEADSGVSINRLVRLSANEDFEGLEAFLGQPGTVGGAIYINAHNIREKKLFADNLFSAKLITKQGKVKQVSKEYFHFAYDKSRIQDTYEIVLSAVLKLKKISKHSPWMRANSSLDYRRKTQPQGVNCAGCIFRNISPSQALKIATPNYTTSAGYLLEQVGLKGKKIGGAKFSSEHANFIVNYGQATAADVLKLIDLAKKRVAERFGIKLQEEIVILGEKQYG